MMTYGDTPEYGGQVTGRDQWATTCPVCKQPATNFWCEQIDTGTLNAYAWITCPACPDDDDEADCNDWD